MSTLKYWDGSAWSAAFPPASPAAPDVQNLTSSDTWTKPAGARFVYAEYVSGGSSGSSDGDANSGGVGGNRFAFLFDAADLAATESVTIGAGGLAVANSARAGGATIFAGLSVTGGVPGVKYQVVRPARFSDGGPPGIGSPFGAGGGSTGAPTTRPSGGTAATGIFASALTGGNGGSTTAGLRDGLPPGGAGATSSINPGVGGNGARGALRLTTIF